MTDTFHVDVTLTPEEVHAAIPLALELLEASATGPEDRAWEVVRRVFGELGSVGGEGADFESTLAAMESTRLERFGALVLALRDVAHVLLVHGAGEDEGNIQRLLDQLAVVFVDAPANTRRAAMRLIVADPGG